MLLIDHVDEFSPVGVGKYVSLSHQKQTASYVYVLPAGHSPTHLLHRAVVRDLIQVLLAHGAARDLALARCWIKHRRRPGAELSVVIEEHTGRGGEIAEAEVGLSK